MRRNESRKFFSEVFCTDIAVTSLYHISFVFSESRLYLDFNILGRHSNRLSRTLTLKKFLNQVLHIMLIEEHQTILKITKLSKTCLNFGRSFFRLKFWAIFPKFPSINVWPQGSIRISVSIGIIWSLQCSKSVWSETKSHHRTRKKSSCSNTKIKLFPLGKFAIREAE